MLRRTLVLAFAGLMLSACNLAKIDEEADGKARALYEQIRTGADLSANADLAPSLKTPAALAELAAVRQSLPPGAPTKATTSGYNFSASNEGTTATLTHAYTYPSSTVTAQTILSRGKDKIWKVTGFHVKVNDGSTGSVGPSAPPAVTVEKTADI